MPSSRSHGFGQFRAVILVNLGRGHLCSQRGRSFVVRGVACAVPLGHCIQLARRHPRHVAARLCDAARLPGGQPLQQGQVDW